MKNELNFTERAVPGLSANFLLKEAQARYLFARTYVSYNSIVCDFACGTGYGVDILSQKANKVYGVDISEEAISFAKSHYLASNTAFIKSDVSETIFKDKAFNLITAFEMIEHLAKPKIFLKEVWRLLPKGGYLILSTPNRLIQSPSGTPMSPYHIKEYSPFELETLLTNYFKTVTLLGQRRNKKVIEAYSDFLKSQKARQFLVDIDVFGIRKLFSKNSKEVFWQSLGSLFGRSTQEKVSDKDYKFSKSDINSCEYIIAVCRK